MFGNTLGWIISAVIAALGGYGAVALLQVSQPTPPTGWVKATIKPLDLTDVATPALPEMNDPKYDAGDLYRQATADYDRHPAAYKAMQTTRDFDESQIAELKGLDLINQAATCSAMHLFSTHPEEVVGFETTVATLDKLNDIATTMSHVVLLAKFEKKVELATRYANGLAVLGYRLYKERVAYIELDAGESALGLGNDLLLSIAREEHADAKADIQAALKARRLDEFTNRIEPVRQVISNQGQQNIGKYAGDMFQMAIDPTIDHVWRVEAIRRLGRLQFNAENRADQLKAPKILRQLADDTKEDLIIRTAAGKARDMTSYDNQSQR